MVVDRLDATAYTIPTDQPESDGTLAWSSTTLVLVELGDDRHVGLGYSYTHAAAVPLIHDTLAPVVLGSDPQDHPATWLAMRRRLRNVGVAGIAAAAIAAVDIALWDLRARLAGLPLVALLGQARPAVPIYGSGGFTSYDTDTLRRQLAGWVDAGIPRVKMKVGRDPAADPDRVHTARRAIGPDAELFVDANGGYDRRQALAMATRFADDAVTWFEEPVSSDDIHGLRLLRDRGPAAMEIAAGEYATDRFAFARLTPAIDVLQADATRCGGISGFIEAAAVAAEHSLPLSAHTAPAVHLHPGCALHPVRHLEWFHDHVRIESMLFDGAVSPDGGTLAPALDRPGLGLTLRRADAERYRVA